MTQLFDIADLDRAIATFPPDRLTFVTWPDDNSVSVYLGDVLLANEPNRQEAEHEALFVIRAFDNGAGWARDEFPGLAAYR